ncbi:heme exporter protein CcmB [Sphingomonas sp. BIUV-7]|uniref:Heme exporter protein B n=1 Tax=Sphingomonas natans TaxID=3063330 RepID=A0ABT8YCG1_9SPHN|nr:heme exporter protein CcmB [Sphingomonas sp. BIUV-7]MDO6415662.1 heme exporter protein CcmB [Sphingomonas sp. BIUV-7]
MKALAGLVARDLRIAWAQGGAVLPLVFYLLVATLLPFAIGPDKILLARIGGGLLLTAALLAALLPVERLVAPDLASGMIDQCVVRGIGEEAIGVAKLIAHWIAFGPPLMIATLPAAALLGLDGSTVARLELGLALATPGLAALAVATAALTAGLRGAGALSGLVMLPLAIPLLIFGAGALGDGGVGATKLLAATSLLLVAGAPFVAGAALRAGRT